MSKYWRSDKRWKKTKLKAIKRDKHCVICKSTVWLEVHHINDGSTHPEQRFKLRNCVTLCSECHRQFHTNFMRSYRNKCTRKDWNNFKELLEHYSSL